jgi:hypothetical protein
MPPVNGCVTANAEVLSQPGLAKLATTPSGRSGD